MTVIPISKKRTNSPNIFNSYNYRVRTPDGTMYIIIMEDHNGKPFKIDAHVGKAGNAVSQWAQALCGLIDTLWSRGEETGNIVGMLSGFISSRPVQISDGQKIFSGPQGIQQALIFYLQQQDEMGFRIGG